MPLFAVLSAAAQVGLGVDASHFKPDYIRHGEGWCERDVESAVGVEQRGILSVELDALLVSQEHGHAGAVFAGVEHLFGFVEAGIEIDFRLAVYGTLSGYGIVTINSCRRNKAGEGVKGFFFRAFAAEARGGADVG